MIEQPPLGVGIVYTPALEPLLQGEADVVDVIEVEPQTYWFKDSPSGGSYRLDDVAFARLAEFPQAKIVHGLACAVGGTAPPERRQLDRFAESIKRLGAPWASEHLSFNRVPGDHRYDGTGFLLPPLQVPRTVALAARHLRLLRESLPVPVAFETGVNYLRCQSGEMSDGRFFARVAQEADCGILLDLHNLWTNERNGRQAVLDALAEMPLERVWEVHLAGGDSLHGYWIDAHSGLVPEPVMDLAREVLPCLPNLKAVIFEIIDDYLPVKGLGIGELQEQMRQIRSLWAGRSDQESPKWSMPGDTGPVVSARMAVSPAGWETAIGKLVAGRQPDSALERRLARDPGIAIYRELIVSVRGGMIVSLLTLTHRLLVVRLGTERTLQLLRGFWAAAPPEQFAAAEARNFAGYLAQLSLEIPLLDEVLQFELAAHRVVATQQPQRLEFDLDPRPALDALREGHAPPPDIVRGRFELLIEP